MRSKLEISKIKVFTVSLLCLLVSIVGSIVINGVQGELIVAMVIGYVTTMINFYLLFPFVYLAFEIQNPCMAFAIQMLRLIIYAVSGWLAIDSTQTGIHWVTGLLAMEAGVIIANIKPNNKKGGVK